MGWPGFEIDSETCSCWFEIGERARRLADAVASRVFADVMAVAKDGLAKVVLVVIEVVLAAIRLSDREVDRGSRGEAVGLLEGVDGHTKLVRLVRPRSDGEGSLGVLHGVVPRSSSLDRDRHGGRDHQCQRLLRRSAHSIPGRLR